MGKADFAFPLFYPHVQRDFIDNPVVIRMPVPDTKQDFNVEQPMRKKRSTERLWHNRRGKDFGTTLGVISIQAEKPRLAKHTENMEMNLSKLTGVDADRIAIAAGTCEGLGFVGEKLGICAYCIATVKKEETNGKDD